MARRGASSRGILRGRSFLREQRLIPKPKQELSSPVERLVRAYDLHMTEVAALAPATRQYRRRYAREFLKTRVVRGQLRLGNLSATDLTAGEIAARFEISKPSVSKHLSILENAGLIAGERRGQFIHYSLVRDNLLNTVTGYLQEVCPVSRPLKRESVRLAKRKA